jgi:hypothetical protein
MDTTHPRSALLWMVRAVLVIAAFAVVAVASHRSTERADALFHFAVIDEVMFGKGGDPDQQFVEIRMNTSSQNFVQNSVLGAFNADGSYFGDILIVPGNVTNSGTNVRWIMGTAAFAAASGIQPDFTFTPVSLPATGMICWGAPGVSVPAPGSWDHTNPLNYVDCVPYNGYSAGNIRFPPATPFGPGDGTSSLTRISQTSNTAADFALACPSPTHNLGGIGYHSDENHTDLPSTKPFDDLTKPNADVVGNDCAVSPDADDDNDGLTDAQEADGSACGGSLTNKDDEDSDNDRTLDGAECSIGTDPNNASSAPTLPQCGATTDTDGDGVLTAREICYFNTNPAVLNTDGDVCHDGKEVASINADVTVNVIDLQQVAGAFGPSTDPDYITDYDMTRDGAINVIDLSFVSGRFGAC